MLINQWMTDTLHNGRQMKKREKKCWCEMWLSLNAVGGREGGWETLILMLSYWLIWGGFSQGGCPSVERERGIGRKRLKVGAGGGEEITWCHDLALVHNLMMNTRPVQHGRLSQWGPISLWLDLWHIYPPLSEGCHLDGEGRSLRAEMTGGEFCGHNCQSSLNMSSNPFRFHIGATIKLSSKPWGLLMPLRKE